MRKKIIWNPKNSLITRVSYLLIFLFKKIEEEVHKEDNKSVKRNLESGVNKLTNLKFADIKLGDNFVEGIQAGILKGVETH